MIFTDEQFTKFIAARIMNGLQPNDMWAYLIGGPEDNTFHRVPQVVSIIEYHKYRYEYTGTTTVASWRTNPEKGWPMDKPIIEAMVTMKIAIFELCPYNQKP